MSTFLLHTTYFFGSSKKVYNKVMGQKPLFGVPSGPGPLFLFVKITKAQYFQHFIAQPFNTVPFFCDFPPWNMFSFDLKCI